MGRGRIERKKKEERKKRKEREREMVRCEYWIFLGRF